MKNSVISIIDHFSSLEDPRVVGRSSHLLIDIITITLCSVISGAESWYDVQLYGELKKDFLKRFLLLPHGIPSHDTFSRVLSIIDPASIKQCFVSWVQDALGSSGKMIAIDGKTARRSYDKKKRKGPLHMISAWATDMGLVLGQQSCDEKSNEITAIPELLRVLDLEGSIVTIDAMGCQKKIAEQIIRQKGDYVFSLKGNQGATHQDVKRSFNQARKKRWRGFKYNRYETKETGHGRIEKRRYWTMERTPDRFGFIWRREPWAGADTIGMVESERTIDGKTSKETRYYISSLGNNAKAFAHAVRGHWGIENSLHWVLDVVFKEDENRTRAGHAQENLAIIRHIALNLIKQEKTKKGSIKGRRKCAGWDNNYLLTILGVKGAKGACF
jgi:predicted transposase YbfD/YdcC